MELFSYWHEETFKSYFLRSLSVHILILLFAILFGRILDIPVPFFNNFSKITAVESVVRVDLVAMPKMTLAELKAVDMSEVQFAKENVEAQAMEEKADVSKQANQENPEAPTFNQEKKKNFENLMKEWGKKKTKNSNADNDSLFNAKIKGKLAQLVAEGNKMSKGSALVGQTEGEASEFTLYLSSLPDRVRPYWRLPSYLKNQGFRCQVKIFVSSSGELIKTALFMSSGNAEYDQKAIEAVKRSSPFPAVPENILDRASKGDMVLGFPL